MQFSIYLNQPRALEWGLNLPQACFFSFLFEVPSWATPLVIDGQVWYSVGKQKLMDELPILTDKADTIKRYMKSLEGFGLIERKTQYRGVDSIPLFRLTDKARCWNRTDDYQPADTPQSQNSEKNPPRESGSRPGKISEFGREKNPSQAGNISEFGREKFPANQPTNSYPYTNDQHNQQTVNNARIDRNGGELTDDWMPSPEVLQRIAISGVPEDFTLAILPEFRAYWLMSPDMPVSGSWDISLLKHAKSQWMKSQNEIGKAAAAPKWQLEDFDLSSWARFGEFNADNVRHWLAVRQNARKLVTQDLIDSVGQAIADGADEAAVPFSMAVEGAMLAGWVNVRTEYVANLFGPVPAAQRGA